MDTVFEILNTSFQSFELRLAVRTIHHDVPTEVNSFAEGRDLTEFFFCNDFVVSPANRGAQVGYIHPGIVIGHKHGGTAFFVKALQNLHVFRFGPASGECQECGSPQMIQKDGNPPLPVESIACESVNELHRRQGNKPWDAQ